MKSGRFRQKRDSGLLPEYGAIFMADNATRKECFERHIFGLPSSFANFVMNVKAGMPLFLFDHQAKKLYGVFEAISDGAMNIVPRAYRSSGMPFPAQVRFRIVWRCVPIPEESFHAAIKENYFTPYKFHFGLSKQQVKRLLLMFEMRRTDTQISQNPLVEGKPTSESITSDFVPDNGNDIDLDGFEQAPSIKTIEMKDPLPDGLDGEDFIPLPTIELDEAEESEEAEDHDAPQLAIYPRLSECGGCLLKDEPESQNDDRGYGDKQSKNGSVNRVGLYSDSPKERSSVFLRLSGMSRVKKQERSHSHDKMDTCRDILGKLENNQETHKKGTTPFRKPKSSKTSVFSRLSYNVERMSASEYKYMSVSEVYSQRKRENDAMETLCQVKSIISSTNEKKPETNKRMRVSKNSLETKTSDHSTNSLMLPSGCKSDDRSNEVLIEESKFHKPSGHDKCCPETTLSIQETSVNTKSTMDAIWEKEQEPEFLSLDVICENEQEPEYLSLDVICENEQEPQYLSLDVTTGN